MSSTSSWVRWASSRPFWRDSSRCTHSFSTSLRFIDIGDAMISAKEVSLVGWILMGRKAQPSWLLLSEKAAGEVCCSRVGRLDVKQRPSSSNSSSSSSSSLSASCTVFMSTSNSSSWSDSCCMSSSSDPTSSSSSSSATLLEAPVVRLEAPIVPAEGSTAALRDFFLELLPRRISLSTSSSSSPLSSFLRATADSPRIIAKTRSTGNASVWTPCCICATKSSSTLSSISLRGAVRDVASRILRTSDVSRCPHSCMLNSSPCTPPADGPRVATLWRY